MAEITPLALRRLEADWRDRRRERMEASLRRRVRDVGGSGSLRLPVASADTNPAMMPLTRLPADLVDQSLPRDRAYTKRGDGSAEGTKAKSPERTSPHRIEPRPAVPNTRILPARHAAKDSESLDRDHEMASIPTTKLEALSSGALPPGIYTLDGGRLVIRPSIPVESTRTGPAMEFVARKVRYDISPDGRLCTMTQLSPRAHTKGPSILRLTDSSGWTRREVGTWRYMAAMVDQAKKKTDQVSRSSQRDHPLRLIRVGKGCFSPATGSHPCDLLVASGNRILQQRYATTTNTSAYRYVL
jgi:hypothetical protein